jgi:cyclase
MLKKRVIFALLYNNGNFMLSRNFRLQKVGNLNWLRNNYNFSQIAFSIDELIVLDVTRGERDSDRFCEHVKALTENCFIPITAGGGIRSGDDAVKLLRSGADKVIVNSVVLENPGVLSDISRKFGRQCIVVSVDVKMVENTATVWMDNGALKAEVDLQEWFEINRRLPFGELYLNSMDRDGTGQGYLLSLLEYLPESFAVPVIIAGGAGNFRHLAEGLKDDRVDAVATAHLFNFVGNGLKEARSKLLDEGFLLARWEKGFEFIQ